jgi:hypothetical protein
VTALPSTLREVSETALQMLTETHQDYIRMLSTPMPTQGRVLTTRTRLGSFDASAMRREGCYLRLVSTVEAYTDVLLSMLFEENVISPSLIVQRLVLQARLTASKTWTERIDGFVNYHQIDLKLCGVWPQLNAAIEVRNSIAHGLGGLTPIQQRTNKIFGKFASIHVVIADGRIALTDDNLAEAADWAAKYVKYLDAESQRW